MTKEQFVEMIANGRDIMFTIGTQGFTILTWTIEGISICKWDDDFHFYYETPEDVVESYIFDGLPLEESVDRIVITNYA